MHAPLQIQSFEFLAAEPDIRIHTVGHEIPLAGEKHKGICTVGSYCVPFSLFFNFRLFLRNQTNFFRLISHRFASNFFAISLQLFRIETKNSFFVILLRPFRFITFFSLFRFDFFASKHFFC
jgi:hypothetical protein